MTEPTQSGDGTAEANCSQTPDEAVQQLLQILPEARPTRFVSARFSCRADGLRGDVQIDLVHDGDPEAAAMEAIQPHNEALRQAAWAHLEIVFRHLPADLEPTARALDHEDHPVRDMLPLVVATTTYELDAMGPRFQTVPTPRASRLEGDIAAVLGANPPEGVRFEVQVQAPITQPLDNLFAEDKLKAETLVLVSVEGPSEERDHEVLEWIDGCAATLRPLKRVRFEVSFFSERLAGRPPRDHPELRRVGWAPLMLPPPAAGLAVPRQTRRYSPGPTAR